MPSYKRIYIFEEILYIISPKYCIFKTHEIGEIKILSKVCKIGKD